MIHTCIRCGKPCDCSSYEETQGEFCGVCNDCYEGIIANETPQCQTDDETCGKHSGIPPCCRRFFINVYRPLTEQLSEELGYVVGLMIEEDELLLDYIQYVRCPGCRATGAYVHLKPCPVEVL